MYDPSKVWAISILSLNEIKAPSIVPGPSQTSAGCKKGIELLTVEKW